MSLKPIVGADAYERVRQILKSSFPGKDTPVSDDTVDAVIKGVWAKRGAGAAAYGLPPPPQGWSADAEPVMAFGASDYPLYMADATHHRVHRVGSAETFESEFTGHLPCVRVPLPKTLVGNSTVDTAIGSIFFSSDHLLGSIDQIADKYADDRHLGYVPERVDLLTPARNMGTRFGAIAVYLGYRRAKDPSPSFYLLEAGTATGAAEVIYFSKSITAPITSQGGYKPSPFSNDKNTYNGSLYMYEDEPVQLIVKANTGNLPFYIQVTVNYQRLEHAPSNIPALLILEAAERISALGKAMNYPTGQPLDGLLAALGDDLNWSIKPGSSTLKSS